MFTYFVSYCCPVPGVAAIGYGWVVIETRYKVDSAAAVRALQEDAAEAAKEERVILTGITPLGGPRD